VTKIKVEWIDGERWPQCAPDPKFPNGIRLDLRDGAARFCHVELPYPARRCGRYLIRCDKCGYSAAVTTAGRPDDPRSVEIGCYSQAFHPEGSTRIITHPKKEPY